ncbi:TetR/AcrR family transcriptional regulator [Nocardia australiensis]|uniref:TetR/AcrR family transcriptional regulator n=1 Tax=Nocardia australiensis TaxID=2887191 RepID=UPI001D1396A4|nr:TetR/AcrR family transcriptional regulator [Nocardia australiensis]
MVTAAEQGEETRARLMAAATDSIAEFGWGAVTTRMVAERAGLRPGLVHYHFHSVTDLLIDASLQMARTEYANVMAGVFAASGPAAMTQILTAIGSYTATDPATVAMSEMMLAATRHERLRDELRQFVVEVRTALTDWFRDQQVVADPEATATVVLALIDGLILHRMIDPALRSVDVTGPLLRAAGLTESVASEGNCDVHTPEGEHDGD